jgi:hypothetical protein
MIKLITLFFLFTISYSQINLQEGLQFGLESNALKGLFLAAEGGDCLNIQEGRCGTVWGINLSSELATGTLDQIFRRHKEIHWSLLQAEDYFCIKSDTYDALFSLEEGEDCAGIREGYRCGLGALRKTVDMKCTRNYGWRINYVQNSYVLQSARYPNLYFYFSGKDCQRINRLRFVNRGATERDVMNTRKCGSVVGLHLNNIQNVLTSHHYKWILVNIQPITNMVSLLSFY